MTSTLKRSDRTMPMRDLTAAAATPLATVTANLMPPEVVAKRRLGWLKRRLAFTLVALVALVGLGFGLSYQQTTTAEDDLAAAQGSTTHLMTDAHTFDDLVRLQLQINETAGLLRAVLSGSLDWSALLGSLNAAAPPGLAVTQVAGQLGAGDGGSTAAAPGAPAPVTDPQAVATIGSLTLSGTARDYRSVARYVDTLAAVKGLAQVEPGGVTSAGGKATFEITASLTKDILVALVIVLIGWFFLVSPQREDTADIQSQVADAQLHNDTLQTGLNELKAEQRNYRKYAELLVQGRKALPAHSDMSSFLRFLQSVGTATSTTVSSVSVGKAAPLTPAAAAVQPAGAPASSASGASAAAPAASTASILGIQITASVTGTEPALRRFLAALSIEKQDRALLVTSVTRGAEGAAANLQVTMTAFVRPATTTAAAPSPSATAGG